ncbi:hypothetical protein [Sediminibacterium soli]|uniref:hypothetical protein n=1 Tax=Sediminibacterium soli TaxID=2698829 RepID=UPI00137B75D1|nr:hypothetical protein [Sediminibacterium soli]NCI45669.1 hypothetical protein [Sediminibacterium soli]
MNWKLPVTLLLLVALAWQSLNKSVIVGEYYASVFEKNCENKSKPLLKCHGRCQMMKRLQAAEKKEQQAPSFSRFDQVLSSRSYFASVNPLSLIKPVHIAGYINTSTRGFARDFFHPPGPGISPRHSLI